jgi:hypothetical protein
MDGRPMNIRFSPWKFPWTDPVGLAEFYLGRENRLLPKESLSQSLIIVNLKIRPELKRIVEPPTSVLANVRIVSPDHFLNMRTEGY